MSETIAFLLKEAVQTLAVSGSENPALEARLLLSHWSGIPHLLLQIEADQVIAPLVSEQFKKAVSRRAIEQVPIQYLIGIASFRLLELKVEPGVLIPRPETEQLVGFVLDFLKPYSSPGVLDLCTGSGAIALAVKSEFPEADVTASEFSKTALSIARANAERLGVDVKWIQGDLFDSVKGSFNVIVSNPPYISLSDYTALPAEVRRHEPKMALTDDFDGFSLIRKLIQTAPHFLVPNGGLFLEIGETQGESVKTLLENSGFREVEIRCDLAGKIRFAFARRP